MTSLTMKPGGEIVLPARMCDRYGLKADTPIRVIETRTGLLLVPLTDAPMDPELARELAEWQELGALTWDQFPYEDDLSAYFIHSPASFSHC